MFTPIIAIYLHLCLHLLIWAEQVLSYSEYILSNCMTFTWRGGLSNYSSTERKQVEISYRSVCVKTVVIFLCEILVIFSLIFEWPGYTDSKVAWD